VNRVGCADCSLPPQAIHSVIAMNQYNEHVVRQFVDGDEFDSSMWTKERDDNGNLGCKLRIKLYFRLIEMKYGPTTGYYQENDDRMGTPHFDRILYDEWKREWKQVIEDFWTGSFWIITPKDYEKLNYGPNRPNIKCSLQIEMVPSPGGAHHKLNVLYTP